MVESTLSNLQPGKKSKNPESARQGYRKKEAHGYGHGPQVSEIEVVRNCSLWVDPIEFSYKRAIVCP